MRKHNFELFLDKDIAARENKMQTNLRYRGESETNFVEASLHKCLIKNADKGWRVSDDWFDIENSERHLFFFLNEWPGAMSTSALRKTYIKMQAKLLEDELATCYIVDTLAMTSKDEPWEFVLDNRHWSNSRIRYISLDKFYEMIFEKKYGHYEYDIAGLC